MITTEAIIGSRGFWGSLTLLGIYKLDPGFLMTSGESLAALHALHAERVAQFVKRRSSSARAKYDHDLYFAFREKRSTQIKRRALLQFVPAMLLAPVAFLAAFGGHAPIILVVVIALAGFVLGTLIDILVRGSSPLLSPSDFVSPSRLRPYR